MERSAVRTIASGTAAFNLQPAVLLLSGVVVCGAAVAIKIIPYGRSFWDFLFILDGAYRIGIGQIPHIDFMSPIGPLTLYLAFLAERLFPGGQPFIGLHALMWLLLLPALGMLMERFERPWHLYGAMALLALIVLVPYTVDKTVLADISYSAIYNRFATGVLYLLGLWYVLPKRRWDSFLLGYVVVLLLFLKITSAVVAIGMLVAAVILRRVELRQVVLAVAGVIAFCVALDGATGVVSAYLRDVVFMGTVNQGGMIYHLAFAAYANWLPLVTCAVVLSLAIWRSWLSRDDRSNRRGLIAGFFRLEGFAIDMLVVLGVAFVAESQNTGGVGMVAGSAILFHPAIRRQHSWRLVGTTMLAATLILPLLDIAAFRTITGIVRNRHGTAEHQFSALVPGVWVSFATLEGAKLLRHIAHDSLELEYEVQKSRFFIDSDPYSTAPAAQAAWCEDVVAAAAAFRARGLAATAQRYAVIAFTDPFSWLLDLQPARGVPLVMELHRTIPEFGAREASRVLADADGIFVSTCELSDGGPTLKMVFQPVLDAEFDRVPLSPCWDFYRRKPGSGVRAAGADD